MVDVFIVVGSKASSNANRLREVAERLGAQAYLVDDADALTPNWFTAGATVGVTAGASTPEHLVAGVIDRLAAWGYAAVREAGDDHENVSFRLPSGL